MAACAVFTRESDQVHVDVVDEQGSSNPLPHIERHSPCGFEWGYGGSGPADTARSLLIHWFGEELANTHYQSFKWEWVAVLPRNGGTISKSDVIHWLQQKGVNFGEREVQV